MTPNILLITTDQQRFDAVGCNNPGFLKTPHLDRLAAEGINFTRAYCPASVCTPSRVSIMSGQHLSRHGSYNIGVQPGIPAQQRFVSRILADSGYWTAHVGKGHWFPWGTKNSPEEIQQAEDNFSEPWKGFAGFDRAELSLGHATWGMFGHYRAWLRRHGIEPDSLSAKELFADDPNDTCEWSLPSHFHSGAWTVERGLAALDARPQNKPFFMHLGFQDPHHPHALPEDFLDRVDPNAVPPPVPEGHPINEAPHIELFRNDGLQESRFRGRFDMAGQYRTPWRKYFADDEKSRITRAHYYSMIQLMDRQIGDLLAGLEQRELLDETLIVFTSDHGEMLGDHGIGQKGPLAFESVLRVPLLARGPGVTPGTVCDECVSLVDLHPTFLAMAGAPSIPETDGCNLGPMLSGDLLKRPGVRVEYKEEPDRIRYKAWIETDWKLVLYGGESFGELYHLAEDPSEYINRYDDPAFREIQLTLTSRLLEDLAKSELTNPRESRV